MVIHDHRLDLGDPACHPSSRQVVARERNRWSDVVERMVRPDPEVVEDRSDSYLLDLDAAGVGFTFLRPNLYFQGLLAFQSMIAKEGHFVAPVGEGRVSAVDVRDIAAVAAIVLTEQGHEGKTYTITGPTAVTHPEMASAIGEAIGRPVAFVDVPPQAFGGALRAAGIPAWQVDGLIEDYAHYARGEAAAISPHVREVTGVEPHDVRTFARDHARAFMGQ
jgi:nucleoside-diphosphate-sugar epimerase